MAVSDEASGTSARRRRQDEPTEHPSLALLVVVTGVLITAIDTTIVVLALPEIRRSLHIGLASVIWVIISYLLVITLLSTQVGRLGDMFGRVRMYEAGFVVFIVGSLACALAWNELSLVVFRLVQGVGGRSSPRTPARSSPTPSPRSGAAGRTGSTRSAWNTGAVLGVVLGGHHRDLRLVAVDLLDQRPHRHRGRGGRQPGPVRPGRAPAAPDRLVGHGDPRPRALRSLVGHGQAHVRATRRDDDRLLQSAGW